MSHVFESQVFDPLAAMLERRLRRVHRGKVRDTYEIPYNDALLVVTTDRVSIFDFVLPATIAQKGEILTAMTVFWLTSVLKDVGHHLVSFGGNIDSLLPAQLRRKPELQRRALVIKKLDMLPVECIVRGYLTGSGLTSYLASGKTALFDQPMPSDLRDGSQLPKALFTPTTKAIIGHDEPVSQESIRQRYGPMLEERSLAVYDQIASYAHSRGIILADSKFEFGANPDDPILADEVATPDSSRFWDVQDWHDCQTNGCSPQSIDKEHVRRWGKTVETSFTENSAPLTGLHRLNPICPAHTDFVRNLIVPEEVLSETALRYHSIFSRLTGVSLSQFQADSMKVCP